MEFGTSKGSSNHNLSSTFSFLVHSITLFVDIPVLLQMGMDVWIHNYFVYPGRYLQVRHPANESFH
jgi:hypothetical protein